MSLKKAGWRVVGGRASVLLAGAVVWPAAVRAQSYIGGEGVRNWSVPENWSPAGVPGAGAFPSFWNYDGLSRTLNYDYAGPAVTLSGFLINQSGTGSNTFQMGGQTLSSRTTYVGSYGSAAFNQSGGVHATDGLSLGYQPQSRGEYTLSGGELRALSTTPSSFTELIGFGGVGVFNHTGGTNTTGNLFVGFQDTSAPNPDGSGTYRMSGSARLQVTSFEAIGEYGSGTGLFEQSGGTHLVAGLSIGNNAAGRGTYRLSGDGSLTANLYEMVGQGGTFEQTGGTHTVNAGLSVGGTTAAPAAYSLSGGALNAKDLSLGGTMDVSGGAVSVSGKMTVGGANGVLNLSGGSVTATTLQNSAAVNASGGTFSGALVNGGTVRASAGAVLTVTGGISGSNAASTAAGRLVVETGATVVASFVRQGSLELNGSGATVPPVVSVRRKADGGGTSVVGVLSIGADPAGAPLGRVDLADNAMVVDYAGASPIADVRSLIRAAWAGGTWTGNGLGSSMAAANAAAMGLGYGEASSVIGASGGTFEGRVVDGTAVVVKYTVMGDATLDGRVNFDDLLALAKHYIRSDMSWAEGDFGYDGVVNFDDLLVLAKHYNQAVGASPVPSATASFEADLAAAFAAAVPEPTGAGIAAGLGTALTLRRRRRVSM